MVYKYVIRNKLYSTSFLLITQWMAVIMDGTYFVNCVSLCIYVGKVNFNPKPKAEEGGLAERKSPI